MAKYDSPTVERGYRLYCEEFNRTGFRHSKEAAAHAAAEVGMNPNTAHRYFRPRWKLERLGVPLDSKTRRTAGQMANIRKNKLSELKEKSK